MRLFKYTLFLGKKQIFAHESSRETNATTFCSNKCSVKNKRTIYKKRLTGIKRSVRMKGFSILLLLCVAQARHDADGTHGQENLPDINLVCLLSPSLFRAA